MRSSLLTPLAAGLLAILSSVPPAFAQQNGAPPPPRLEKLEEGEEPAVTIRKPAERKIEEKRAPGGKVTEVKVTSGGSTYYLKPNDPAGSAMPGDQEGTANRGAQWEVLQFDWFSKQPKTGADEASSTQAEPAPPPPPSTSPAAAPDQGPAKK
jgi:hypothetical protein